ncbi:SoxR reducing system RseC family protein [Inediibacterium massiliense]|uniref:SoxR reducing system RseC family protein n=1 Tax=Inediibacterium massiliense TaxID=1658111 RepID=UPI0006B50BA7|nr:SoxR reducing system RseC family protein [Inediibacterium massiliense]
MNQVGKVIEVLEDHRAQVLMRKHSACGECGACQYGQENMNLKIIAMNQVNAKEGDTVEVNLETQNVLGAAFIAYVIPLVALLVGVIGTSFILPKTGFTGNVEVYSIVVGFILTIIAFGFIKLNENSFKKQDKYVPVISKVVENEK